MLISSYRAFACASPSVSEEERKKKTGVRTPGAAKVMGFVQVAWGS
ncbi:MAG: hypothetical protein QM783_01560 [Phycisphaerales bacterium]